MMGVIRLPIDTKSLYFNIKNDNESGHTATVATPLKQGASLHQDLAEIYKIPENINSINRENLISKILSKSRAAAKINGVYVFDAISVNGEMLENIPSFCIYIREETDPKNVHFGRQKVHYPPSFVFEDVDININNRKVTKAISEHLHGYAFIVEAFEYCEETGVLNFDILIAGEPNIPYSKVFINRRGVGNKFTSYFSESSDVYDYEIIALRDKFGYTKVGPENFDMVMSQNAMIAQNLAVQYLEKLGAANIRLLKEEYPYALYDLAYTLNQTKQYLMIKYTSTKSKYFNLPLTKVQFCNDFCEATKLMLITDINGSPEYKLYTINDLNNMSKLINSITYEDRNE